MTSLDPTDLQLELTDAPRAVGSLVRDAISQSILDEADDQERQLGEPVGGE